MSLTVIWSVQARNQYVASLAYIAKEDLLSAELVYQRLVRDEIRIQRWYRQRQRPVTLQQKI